MPKVSVKDCIKLKKFISDYPNEFSLAPTNELYCNFCECIVKHEKRFFVESHRKSIKHAAKREMEKVTTKPQFLKKVCRFHYRK